MLRAVGGLMVRDARLRYASARLLTTRPGEAYSSFSVVKNSG
jgi:hypothetical protein